MKLSSKNNKRKLNSLRKLDQDSFSKLKDHISIDSMLKEVPKKKSLILEKSIWFELLQQMIIQSMSSEDPIQVKHQ